MIVIGITGGIASGKSTIARMMAQRGITHVDADVLVHGLMKTPSVISEIAQIFPSAIKNGAVDRSALGAIVAKDKAALIALEMVLHPAVREAELAALKQSVRQNRRAVILDIPLLFESGAEALCDIVISAAAPLDMRRKRAFLRKGMTGEKFDRLVARQLDEVTRNLLADVVIPTTLGKAFTRRRVELLLRELGLR
ncbi:MAG: dephospho-CoA kinase [Alphaproteobacteria bacterium]|nr:dephospho-CoA kinase [Alphaproteobacteria bacterium]